MSYWALTVITNLITVLPVVGQDVLTCGSIAYTVPEGLGMLPQELAKVTTCSITLRMAYLVGHGVA